MYTAGITLKKEDNEHYMIESTDEKYYMTEYQYGVIHEDCPFDRVKVIEGVRNSALDFDSSHNFDGAYTFFIYNI